MEETLASLHRRKRSCPPRQREEYHADFEDVAEAEGLAPPQSKRKRAASAAAASASLEDQPLIDIIKHNGRLISHAVKRLVEDYESKKNLVTFQILTMLFKACGAKHEIYPDYLRESDVDDIVVSLVDQARKGLVEDNYNSKHKDLQNFKQNLVSFWDSFVLECKNGLLFDDLLFQKIKDYVVALSCAPPRVYRQVASLIGLQLVTSFISVAKTLGRQRETTQRQLNVEMKKQSDGPLIESLNNRLSLMAANITYLEELMRKIFSGLFINCYRDVDPEIQMSCIRSLGIWVVSYPSLFLQDIYLKYLGWALNDKNAGVRRTSILALQSLYEVDDNIPSIGLHTERFYTRIIQLVDDIDVSVAVSAIGLIKQLLRHQLLSDDDLGPLYDLLIDERPMIRHAIGELVYDHLIRQNIKISHPRARDGRNDPSEVHIGQMLQILREFSDVPVLSSYVIEDIWDDMKAVKDWKCMVSVLLDINPAIELTDMDGTHQEILENSRREITSALWTRHPQLLRKFIYDKAKISPPVDMMTLLKLELYSYKKQEKHFKTAIDLIIDAFFKHGEQGPLRSCIKAITFCCIECQADLKEYAENKLKNLEDELVSKVRTTMKEVEVMMNTPLLVNLKRLYELQLSKHVKNDSLFEDMYGIIVHLRDIDNEVKIFLLLNMYFQVAWSLDAIDSENPSETCIDELLSKQSALFDQLYYYLAVLPTYRKERSTTTLSRRVCIITAHMWCLFKKSNYSSTRLESLGYLPQPHMVPKFWKLCEQQLNISEDEDANEEYIEDTNRDAVMVATAKLLLTDIVSKDYLGPEIVSHYASHGASTAEIIKYLIISLKKNANFDMGALSFEALKRVVTMIRLMPLDYLSFKDSCGSGDSFVSTALMKTQVFVKAFDRTLSFQIDTREDVNFLKEEIEKRLQINVSHCTFTCGLSTLESGVPFCNYGITTDSHIHMNPRLRGGSWFVTLLYFVQDYQDQFHRKVELPDRTEDVEFTELACLILSSWLHCLTSAWVAGKTWNGNFDLESFAVVGYLVKAKVKPRKGLTRTKLHNDCTRFTELCRTYFVVNNRYPPYFKHLLKKLESLQVDFLSSDEQFAIDYHMSLVPSLNRVSVLHHIKREYDGWSSTEKGRFRDVLDDLSLPVNWLTSVENVPVFREVIERAMTDGRGYQPTGFGAFLLSKNYTSHIQEYSWIEFIYDQYWYHYQWFKCNNGVELMLPKHLKDFFAEMIDLLIDEGFAVKELIRACGVSARYAKDLSSSDSSSSDSPSKRKRAQTLKSSSQKRRRTWVK